MMSVCEQPFSRVSRTMVSLPVQSPQQVWSHMRVVDGKDYLIMREDDVLAIIDGT